MGYPNSINLSMKRTAVAIVLLTIAVLNSGLLANAYVYAGDEEYSAGYETWNFGDISFSVPDNWKYIQNGTIEFFDFNDSSENLSFSRIDTGDVYYDLDDELTAKYLEQLVLGSLGYWVEKNITSDEITICGYNALWLDVYTGNVNRQYILLLSCPGKLYEFNYESFWEDTDYFFDILGTISIEGASGETDFSSVRELYAAEKEYYRVPDTSGEKIYDADGISFYVKGMTFENRHKLHLLLTVVNESGQRISFMVVTMP